LFLAARAGPVRPSASADSAKRNITVGKAALSAPARDVAECAQAVPRRNREDGKIAIRAATTIFADLDTFGVYDHEPFSGPQSVHGESAH
jgi:hypothetical protein